MEGSLAAGKLSAGWLVKPRDLGKGPRVLFYTTGVVLEGGASCFVAVHSPLRSSQYWNKMLMSVNTSYSLKVW